MNRLRLQHPSPFVYLVVATAFVLTPRLGAQTANNESANKLTGAITGRVISSAGEPLAGATVSASGIGTNSRPTATADARGNFKLDGLAPGVYFLSAGMPGYVNPQRFTLNDAATYYHLGDSVTLTLMKGAVITGTVTGPDGPLVGVGVFATRVRDTEGRKVLASLGYPERRTDDRGVFRFYGLIPGSYLVYAARPRLGTVLPSAFDNDTPVYYPSSTRDTATEILVGDGDEVTADLRYRAEAGHAISGRVNKASEGGNPSFGNQISISLVDVHDRAQIDSFGINSTEPVFAFYGVPDGDYELTARQFLESRDELRSPPLRVTVRGADVTGLSLSLAPLASIDGQLVIESDPKLHCGKRPDSAAQETMIWIRRYEPQTKTTAAKAFDPVSVSATNYSTYAVSNAKGLLSWKNLPGGAYRIDPVAPASGWYIRSISKGLAETPTARAASSAVARDGISVRNGEHFTGLVVTISEGAAQVQGHIAASEGQTLPPRPAVYLVPAEPNASENVLRFYEARADANGAFTLTNVAPGSYWVVARAFEETASLAPPKSIRRDAALRTQVVQAAESQKKALTLKPCEELKDFDMKMVSEARP